MDKDSGNTEVSDCVGMESRRNSDVLEEISDGVVCCENCRDPFSPPSRLPRLLSCLHSFCDSCVLQLNDDGCLTCPLCKRVTMVTLPMPVDFAKLALVEMAQIVNCREGLFCEGCTSGGNAQWRCQECRQYLCVDCKEAHSIMNVFQGHTILSLEEAVLSPSSFVRSSDRCKRHVEERLKLFCTTCQRAECTVCALTTHHEGHKFVEMASAVPKKKKEMLSLCGQLDQMVPTFRIKLERSNNAVAAVDSHLEIEAQHVSSVFDEITSALKERQSQLLHQLKVKAGSDKEVLTKQADRFRGHLSSVTGTAQYARRLLLLGMDIQLMEKYPDIEKSITELWRTTTSRVETTPSFEVTFQKVEELIKCITYLGHFGEIDPPLQASPPQAEATAGSSPSREGDDITFLASEVKHVYVPCPAFELNSAECCPDCSVGPDKMTLWNERAPAEKRHADCHFFGFCGTRGTNPILDKSSYWQVACSVMPRPSIRENKVLCEVGVATCHALTCCVEAMCHSKDCAMAAKLYLQDGHVKINAWHKMVELVDAVLALYSSGGAISRTLGFLLDAPRQHLHIIDVDQARVLCGSHVDLDQPLWPVLRVGKASKIGGYSHLTLQSGPKLDLFPALVSLLNSLLSQ